MHEEEKELEEGAAVLSSDDGVALPDDVEDTALDLDEDEDEGDADYEADSM